MFVQVALALAAGEAWTQIDAAHAVPVMVALLVMSCPCAMSMAVPSAMACAHSALLARPEATTAQGDALLAAAARVARQNLYGPAGAGRLGGAMAGGHHHAAVFAGGGRQCMAPAAPSMGRRARRRRGATRAMSILYLLLPLSLAFVLAIGVALWWAVFSGQYDDTEDQGAAILRDNDN
ncbi:outer membrane protein [Bordetella pertussis]|nr:outer membrane protein [Bordetella pertussis]